MVVLITGVTGSVGRALSRVLRREGHSVVGAVRSVERARNALGPEIELVDVREPGAMRGAIERADAVVNLAGESIADQPWTDARKRDLRNSRVGLTRLVSEYIRAAAKPPRVFISASAIGFYPDRADTYQDESAEVATDFLGALCQEWEEAALRAKSDNTRVVCLRIGVVLDAESGALAKLLPIYRMGLGGRLGTGKQYFSWIHLDDLLGAIQFALRDDSIAGAVNATAPEPVTNRQLTHELATQMRRPAVLSVPSFALRLAWGARASLMLKSQRVVPRALERAGYRFAYPSLSQALAEIVSRQGESAQITRHHSVARPLGPGRATHVLTQITELNAPLSEVFAFFSRAQNLAWITPPWMGFAIAGRPPEMIHEGTIIEYDIKLGPVPVRWRTRIAKFEEGVAFVDNQERGPYELWWHEHRFEQLDGGTRMIDQVFFRLPLGALGNLVAGPMVRGLLQRIFAYRAQAMGHRFGARAGQMGRKSEGEVAQHPGREVPPGVLAPAGSGR